MSSLIEILLDLWASLGKKSNSLCLSQQGSCSFITFYVKQKASTPISFSDACAFVLLAGTQ